MCPRLFFLLLCVVHNVESSIATISLFTFIPTFIGTRLVLASLCFIFFTWVIIFNCGSMLLLHLFRCSCVVVVVRRYVSLLVVASQYMCTFFCPLCLNVEPWASNLLHMFYIIMFYIFKNVDGYSISRIKMDHRMQLFSVQQSVVNAANMCLLLVLYSICTVCDKLLLYQLCVACHCWMNRDVE